MIAMQVNNLGGLQGGLFVLDGPKTIYALKDARTACTYGYGALPMFTSVLQRESLAGLQGGLFVFDGPEIIYAHKDAGTADHAPMDQVLEACCAGRQ